jgi:uncharacterized protein YkwD
MKSVHSRLQKAISLLLSLLLLSSMSSTVLAADSGHFEQEEARTILGMINNLRSGSDAWYWNKDNKTKTKCKNLTALAYDKTLEKVAMVRAKELATLYDSNHKRPDGSSCFTAYPKGVYAAMGENIAMGFPSAKSVMGVEPLWNPIQQIENDGWLEANVGYEGQGHRRNMLSDQFTHVGVGHYVQDGIHYWAQEFGSKTTDIKLTWTRSSSVTGYQIQYTTDKKFKKNVKTVKIKKNKTTSYTIKKAKMGKTYYVRIRGYKKSKKKTRYSKWGAIKKIQLK